MRLLSPTSPSVALVLLAGACPLPAAAADATAQAGDGGLRALLLEKIAAINAQQRELLEKLADIDEQRRELELLVNRVNDLDAYRGGTDTAGAGEPPVVGAEQKQQKDAQAEAIPELPRISFDVGGVLTPQGRLVLEPSVEYLYSSVNRISVEGFTFLPAFLIGRINILEADRDTYIGALTARYGLTNRLEFEVKVPYVYRDDSLKTQRFLQGETDELQVEEDIFEPDGNDIGDVEFGLRYQVPRRNPAWPYIVGNLRVKSDTGTDPFEVAADELATGSGFWSINPSLTLIYPSDPVVFFGSAGYLWSIQDDKGVRVLVNDNAVMRQREVDVGDAVRLNFGMGLGLNDRSSLSISYQLDLFSETSIQGQGDVPGSDVTIGKLLIGYSLRLPGGTPLNLAVGIGATDEAPDSDLTFRLPFNLFR